MIVDIMLEALNMLWMLIAMLPPGLTNIFDQVLAEFNYKV